MKIFEGIVISIGMERSAIVEVLRRTPHPLYKKLIKRSKKYKADTAGFEVSVGNQVRIVETRPVSKGKYFKIMNIVGVKQIKNQKLNLKSDTEESTKETKVESSVKVKKTAEKPVRKTAKKGSK